MFKIKKNYRRKRRRENSPVDFTFFGYADVIKYQEKLTISCERAQITIARDISVYAVIKP